jgi:hypothetical protein
MPGTSIPHYLAEPLVKFLQSATPDQIESLLSLQHAYLQAGVVRGDSSDTQRAMEDSARHTRSILARDAS